MADARGRTGFEQVSYPQADFLNQALDAVRQVTVDANERAGLDGASIGRLFATRRLQVLEQLCRDRPIKTP
jgi:tRNA nucleotidyltransferase (CCA-adding enzyme)